MLSFLSKGGFGRLSESFAVALRRVRAGDSFPHAMLAASDHCGSQLASRAFHLITVSYETGGDMYFALREAASDTVSFFALMRERSSQLSLQRYTILAASCALVPFILGTVASLAPLLSASSSGSQQPNPLSILNEACMAYLLINSLSCSCLIAISEGKPSKAALYFSLVAPLSQLCFIASSTGFSMAFFA
jgi:archaellum biogenesis protein FlaJ (TadC family)